MEDSIIEAIRLMPQTSLDLSGIGLGEFAIATPTQKAVTASAILEKLKHLEPAQRLSHTQFIAGLVKGLPDDLMLTSAELKALHGHGMEIGGHTVSHPILAKLDDQAAMDEINTNKTSLEQLLNTTIRYFAYPNGKLGEDYRLSQIELVKHCQYQAALSTEARMANSSSSIWQLPRFTPWDATQSFKLKPINPLTS